MQVHPAPAPEPGQRAWLYLIEVLPEPGGQERPVRRWLCGDKIPDLYPGIDVARAIRFGEYDTAVIIARTTRFGHLRLAVRMFGERVAGKFEEAQAGARNGGIPAVLPAADRGDGFGRSSKCNC